MYDVFSKIAFSRIEEAINKGEFQNLTGQGERINFDFLSSIPPENRAAYSLLRNSGFVPEEVQLLKEIGELREKIASMPEDEDRKVLKKKLIDTEVKYNLMTEIVRRRKR